MAVAFPMDTFLTFMATGTGRDKVNRFAAYFSKYLIWQLKQTGGDKDTIANLSKFQKVVAEARKLMRVGRSLEYVQAIPTSLAMKDDVQRVVNVAKNAALALWLYYDAWEWLHIAGLYKPDDLKGLKRQTAWFWFVGLLFSVIANVMKLRDTQAKLLSLRDAEETDQTKKDLKDAKKNAIKNYLDLAKNSIDLLLPSTRLDYIQLEDGYVGIAGTITSIIGFYDQWQKVASGKA